MPIVRETDNLEPDSRFDKKPCSIKPRQSGLCRTLTLSIACVLALASCTSQPGDAAAPPSRDAVREALHKAVEFYRTQAATQGGYHFRYAADLSYGRSEQAEGPTEVSVQRQGTPIVGMAYLTAWEATGDHYYLEAVRETAHALVNGQQCSGGWDYIIEFDEAKRRPRPYLADENCSVPNPPPGQDGAAGSPHYTTFDDNVSQAALRLLMRADRELNFEDEKIHAAAGHALESLLKAQYPNGAWPQRYYEFPDPEKFPVTKAGYPDSWPRTWPGPDYRGHYTLNDNSIVDIIDALLEAARIYDETRYRAAAEKGGGFILSAQMPEPQPGWAQQYDIDMHPAWARIFEPPSITGGESQSVMQALLMLYRETGDKKYLEPLPKALAYYRGSALPEVENPSEIRQRVCPAGSVCMARFYELKTNKPLYITKGTRVDAATLGRSLIDGYELSYSDESVITHYNVLTRGDRFEKITAEYDELAVADPSSIRRPGRLKGLSPWDETPGPPLPKAELAEAVRQALAGLDERGAWLETGAVGKADRLVRVFAANEMVVTLGGRVLPMNENDVLEVFPGNQPPAADIIRSATFARNVETLSAYLATAGEEQ